MFLKKFKNIIFSFLLILNIIPLNVFAYSDYIIASGKNIGIEIKSKGILVVGLYNVNEESPGKDSGIKLGDRIIKIEDEYVNNIPEMISKIKHFTDKETIKVTYIRNDIEYSTNLKLVKDKDNVYKTGLYVKDTINGIGTLTFIDPETKQYGALGHQIIDKNTLLEINVDKGKIYKSEITGINKSTSGIPGEKNARFYSNIVYGTLDKNTINGIFGNYNENIDGEKLYKVANKDEIELGNAKILTVLKDETVNEYDIEIIKINNNDSAIKNILFNIVDPELLDIAGGVVQGMSGSPIIQSDKIVGAVTHVVVDSPSKGYGIFITNMLEEMEKQ